MSTKTTLDLLGSMRVHLAQAKAIGSGRHRRSGEDERTRDVRRRIEDCETNLDELERMLHELAPASQMGMTGLEVLRLARFVIPAWVRSDEDAAAQGVHSADDANDQLGTEITIAHNPPTAPPGLWAWCTDYPEEGAQQLDYDEDLVGGGVR